MLFDLYNIINPRFPPIFAARRREALTLRMKPGRGADMVRELGISGEP